jgi:hypothetical protein
VNFHPNVPPNTRFTADIGQVDNEVFHFNAKKPNFPKMGVQVSRLWNFFLPQFLQGTDGLAYFDTASLTKTKFHNIYTWAQYYKTFYVCNSSVCNKLLFVLCNLFQLSLMFAGKAMSLPKGEAPERFFAQVSYGSH